MPNSEYNFFFEKQGLSGEEGPIDPAQQYFEGAHADHAVVRETGQNTLDNRGKAAKGPIRMVFELAEMKTSDIPGIECLRERLDAVAIQTKGQQGHDRMVKAAAQAKGETIPVLRISDYNTTGLTGSESLGSKGSPLSRLTRGKGGSVDDERGGSFGIGSAVGPMASDLCTVIYTSVPEDAPESVMAAYTRLATHSINGESYRAEGYFTQLACKDDFKYQRPAPKIGQFSERTEPGTDIYILGYRMAEQDPKLERVCDAVIDNFMASIKEGRLIVEGISSKDKWIIDASTLEGFAKKRKVAHAFYQALQDQEPAKKVISKIGEVSLYINLDDSLPSKLHTITMRAPLMKIDTFKHNSISAKYAAVLVCDSLEGNKYLRQLEPPQHHKWDAERDPKSGRKVIDELKSFVRASLKERVGTEIGDEVKIDGLARFLPAKQVENENLGLPAAPSSSPNEDGSKLESSSVTGSTEPQEPIQAKPNSKVRVKIQRQAKNNSAGGSKGGKKNIGGNIKRTSNTGTKGKGASRIPADILSFRSWCIQSDTESTSVMALAITAESSETGDIKLVALGLGGEPEEQYSLPISRAVLHTQGDLIDVELSGNTLKNITLHGGEMTRIDVYMPAGERYRLGVI